MRIKHNSRSIMGTKLKKTFTIIYRELLNSVLLRVNVDPNLDDAIIAGLGRIVSEFIHK